MRSRDRGNVAITRLFASSSPLARFAQFARAKTSCSPSSLELVAHNSSESSCRTLSKLPVPPLAEWEWLCFEERPSQRRDNVAADDEEGRRRQSEEDG
ncbi:hypothetical protein NL676_029190 [Syzygium grande]|nr:hypothetical protein NL676_029181 [Syzygium grande]KAI6683277.1 hypothetical protein NL676_029190 [Syzygium grande]